MTYDDWLFEQDWNAATSGNYMPSETGVGNTYDDYLFDLDWNLATSGQAMTNEVIQSVGLAIDTSQPYVQQVAKAAGAVLPSVVSEETSTASARKGVAIETSDSKKEGSVITGVTDKIKAVSGWMDQNKELTKILAGAVGGAVGARERRKTTAAQSQSAKEQIELADQLRQQANQRYSDSVTGLRKPPTGMLSSPLVRKDGGRVFDANGKLIRS